MLNCKIIEQQEISGRPFDSNFVLYCDPSDALLFIVMHQSAVFVFDPLAARTLVHFVGPADRAVAVDFRDALVDRQATSSYQVVVVKLKGNIIVSRMLQNFMLGFGPERFLPRFVTLVTCRASSGGRVALVEENVTVSQPIL